MAKREPHWVKLFIRELERTGNVRIASERAGVDYTSAYQRRKRHGAFAERWEEALARFAQNPSPQPSGRVGPYGGRSASGRSREGERGLPSPGSPSASPSSPSRGEEIVVRPDGKVIRGSEGRWGKRAQETFLLALTTGGNVRLAARAAGFSTQAVYKRRLKDRRFAAAWDAALETGKARVQAYLVEAATRTFDPDELPVSDDIPKVSIGEAINIARLGGPGAGKPRTSAAWDADEGGQFVTDEELDAARERIFERLQRIQENIVEQERETGCCHNCGQPLCGEPGESLYQGPKARLLLVEGKVASRPVRSRHA